MRTQSPTAIFPKGIALTILVAALAPGALAQRSEDEVRARDDRIAELERKVEVLAEELERTRAEVAVPEEPTLMSIFGMGPAASKVYQQDRGLSIGAYGEAFYRNIVGDKGSAKDSADFLRMVLYTGYKFNDWLVFNSEIEFEHATSGSTVSAGSGSVSVEFASLDFLLHDAANIRAGMLLVPMGFLNQIHEPPYFYGVSRPEVERQIIPSTWRENGAGLFGSFFDQRVDYKLYVVNGLSAEGFSASGLRGGRQKGNRALAEHLAVVGRIDTYPFDGFTLGASAYYGKSGQNQFLSDGMPAPTFFNIPDTDTTIWDVHAEYKAYGLSLRALVTGAHLRNTSELTTSLRAIGEIGASEVIGKRMLGAYGEIAYDVLPFFLPDTGASLEPFFRYEWFDTNHDVASGFSEDPSREIEIHTVGFSFKPIPQVVIKADYRSRDAKGGKTLSDEFNVGIGFAF